MPAPQVAGAQKHFVGVVGAEKLPFESAPVLARAQAAGFGLLSGDVVGNGSALDCRRAITCPAVKFVLAASTRAATPDTIGAAKLVPILASFSGLPLLFPLFR